MKFQDSQPQEEELPTTVYALKSGTPLVTLCLAVDLQTAEAIKNSAFPTAQIVSGTIVDD